jgi:HemY protein
MMRRVVLIVLVASIAVGLVWEVAHLPGLISAQIGTWHIEARTPVAVLGLVLLVVLTYFVFRGLGLIWSIPRRWRQWQTRRSRTLGEKAVTRALVALAAGEAAPARRESARARRFLGDTPQTLLLAAQAARLAGKEDEAERLYQLLANHAEAAFLGFRGLLQQAVSKGDWKTAAELARKAEASHPGAAWLRAERLQLAIQAGSWKEAASLATAETPRHVLLTAAAQEEKNPKEALRLARRAWEENPEFVPAALIYAERLRASGHARQALSVLQRTWQKTPHPDLAEAALQPLTTPLERWRAAKRFVDANGEQDPEALLLLARVALAAGLLGEARRYAEAARARLNQRRVWLLLADIEAAEGGSTQALQEDLRQAALAEPDPTWCCTSCGATYPSWRPVCLNCHAFGRLAWTSPMRAPVVAETVAAS